MEHLSFLFNHRDLRVWDSKTTLMFLQQDRTTAPQGRSCFSFNKSWWFGTAFIKDFLHYIDNLKMYGLSNNLATLIKVSRTSWSWLLRGNRFRTHHRAMLIGFHWKGDTGSGASPWWVLHQHHRTWDRKCPGLQNRRGRGHHIYYQV